MKKLITLLILVIGILLISIFKFNQIDETFKSIEPDIQTDVNIINKDSIYLKSELKIPVIKLKDKNIQDKINKKIESDIMKEYDDFFKQAEEYLDDMGDDANQLYLNTDFEVMRNRGNLYSIVVKYYTYSGGAHGNYVYVPYNIDLTEGEFIYIEDLFKKRSNYIEVINREIKSQIKDTNTQMGLENDSTSMYNFNTIDRNQKFYFEDNTIVIIFDLYEIAPYAEGIPEFSIELERLKNIINSKYLNLI